jgi:hypothetical protein
MWGSSPKLPQVSQMKANLGHQPGYFRVADHSGTVLFCEHFGV